MLTFCRCDLKIGREGRRHLELKYSIEHEEEKKASYSYIHILTPEPSKHDTHIENGET